MIGILAVDGTEASGYTSPLESSFPGGYRDQTKSCYWVIGGISFSALAKYTTIFSPLSHPSGLQEDILKSTNITPW